MRMIMIEQSHNPQPIYINPDNVSWVGDNGSYISIGLVCGKVINTKFTDAQHAIDYIQRATSASLGVA